MKEEAESGPFVVPASKTSLSDDDRLIAANVLRLRKDAGMSQAGLADAMKDAGQAHWRQNTVSRVEHERQKLDVGELRALAGILGDVFVGTDMASTGRDISKALVRNVTVHKLRAADEALAEALLHVRGLRVIHESDYGADDVRADYEEDARRGEHQAEE